MQIVMICEFYFWNVGCRYILWEGDMLKCKLWNLTLHGTLQQFQHGVLENLSRRVQGVNGEAQQLIQSAAPGVDTDTLETDQESLMDKWNTLNAKVKEDISLTFIYLLVGGHWALCCDRDEKNEWPVCRTDKVQHNLF